ncbi:MAG: EAL domain-containing protein [Clostridiales bacterium]|nr:EAL domain-containing protein [Clostridiales bacterium]
MESFRVASGFKRRVLIVDDELVNREILSNIFKDTYDVTCVCDGSEAWEILHSETRDFSLVLLDLLMPNMDGFELLERIKGDDTLKSIPIIVMTSEKDAEVRSIRQGAADFITKPYDMPEVILARCERIIELSEDKNTIRSAEKDVLTGLYTRGFFFEYIRQIDELIDASMDALVFNIDRFHLVNEIYGRRVGNEVLVKVAQIISDIMGPHAAISGRPEGDTFFVYCTHLDSYDEIIERIRAELNSAFANLRLRTGIYQNVDKSIDAQTRFDRAKIAADRVRGDYSTSVAYYSSELHDRSLYSERLINDIDDAIRNEDLKVYFQPKYEVTGDVPRLRSAEALVRWVHPELGLISPGDFVPLFESNGLIRKVDNYVWEHAAAYVKQWRDRYGFTLPVSVNVSRIDIYDPELEQKFKNILAVNGLTEKELLLEITESAYSEDAGKLIEVVESLRHRGFKVEMDDFGSGYSSLNMITTLPIDVLKLDMKFVRNMGKDDKSLKLVELIIDIARFLDVPVVAEGVETEEQLNTLKKMGCEIIQGYYFSKPVPAEEFVLFIEKEINS